MASSNVEDVANQRASSILKRLNPLVGTIKQTNPAAAKASATKSAASVKEIAQLSIQYVKQETKVPLNGIGRFIAFGAAGAILLGNAAVLLVLALLRGLQTALSYERTKRTSEGFVADRGPLSGSWTWAPYLLTALAGVLIIGFVAFRWTRDAKTTDR